MTTSYKVYHSSPTKNTAKKMMAPTFQSSGMKSGIQRGNQFEKSFVSQRGHGMYTETSNIGPRTSGRQQYDETRLGPGTYFPKQSHNINGSPTKLRNSAAFLNHQSHLSSDKKYRVVDYNKTNLREQKDLKLFHSTVDHLTHEHTPSDYRGTLTRRNDSLRCGTEVKSKETSQKRYHAGVHTTTHIIRGSYHKEVPSVKKVEIQLFAPSDKPRSNSRQSNGLRERSLNKIYGSSQVNQCFGDSYKGQQRHSSAKKNGDVLVFTRSYPYDNKDLKQPTYTQRQADSINKSQIYTRSWPHGRNMDTI